MRFSFLLLLSLAHTQGNPSQVPSLARMSEIGCSDCGTAAQFATISDVVVTDSGHVLVVTTEAPMLRYFDRSGAVRWSIGRTGTGPGEYRLPIRAVMGPQGIQVVDMTLRRLTRLNRTGAFVASAPINGFASAAAARGRSGELVLLIDDFRGSFTLQRWMPDDSGTTIGPVPRSTAANTGTLTIPSIAVAPSGQVAVLRDPNEYRILILSPRGQTQAELVRDVPRARRTPGEVAATERRRAAAAGRARGERALAGGSGPVLPSRPNDDLKPHIFIDGLRYDDTGRLWVKTMRGNERSTVLDVFTSAGSYLGEITVPAAIGAWSIAGRWLVADVESEDGTPRIVLWEIRGR